MLIRSISGVRGLVKPSLNDKVIIRYARALNSFLPEGAIIIGRDSRPSGEEIIDVVIQELMNLGRDVIFCGIVPTPTVQFMVNNTEAIGGLVVTASHNPIEWNGLKFIKQDSTFFNQIDCDTLFSFYDKDETHNNKVNKGMVWHEKNAIQKHIISCASLKCISLNQIQERTFKVVIDSVNGAGADALPSMLKMLGCEVFEINCEPTGKFTRGTEPLPENLVDLQEKVLEVGADIGFAVDPDADRLAIVNNLGEAIGEELTIVIAADGYMINNKNETFVTNLSTSIALDKLAKSKNCDVIRSAVGEINVVNLMNEVGANLGGEGNGGVILREAHLGRDSLVAVSMVLNRLSQTSKELNLIQEELPKYFIIKDKINIEKYDYDELINNVKKVFKDSKVNSIDGIKFSWENKWIHLRKSNTEPIIRIYAEGTTQNEAKNLILRLKSVI